MKADLERCVAVQRFSMKVLYNCLWPILEKRIDSKVLARLQSSLGPDSFYALVVSLIRTCFLIELVKETLDSTKYQTRWAQELQGDPRFADAEECAAMFVVLFTELGREERWHSLLKQFFAASVLPYEIPIDYVALPKLPTDRIHRSGNLAWLFTDSVRKTVTMRSTLLDPTKSPDAEFFIEVMRSKIQVKTYLTDRALTGLYKTNREKRWETHPRSVQFSKRGDCLEIEHRLLIQLCQFSEFPRSFQESLQRDELLPAELEVFRCPVTLEPMSYPAFRGSLFNPTHGKSDFQVGHLNPLKAAAQENLAFGHSAQNISWISVDGNRIQGHLTLEAVRELIKKTANNYKENGLI